MIKFASSVIPVGQLLPKADRKRFVKIAQNPSREGAIQKLAAMMHNEYVDKMLESEEYAGQKNPQRMRDDKTGSGKQINILQPFENLTPGWKEENLKAAEVAYDLVKANIDDIDNKMEEIAEKIHQAWSARNSYSPLAILSYAKLSEDEKDKDRHQVELARDLIMDQTDIYNLGKGDKQIEPYTERKKKYYGEPNFELKDEPDPSRFQGSGSIMDQTDIYNLGKGDKQPVSIEPNTGRKKKYYGEPKFELKDEPDPSRFRGSSSKNF